MNDQKPTNIVRYDGLFKSGMVMGVLYFLTTGDYLFRWKESGNRQSSVGSKYLAATDVNAAFSHSEIDSGWLPTGILRFGYGPGGRWCVYDIPPRRVEITILGMKESPQPPLSPAGKGGEVVPAATQKKAQGKQRDISIMLPHLVMLGLDKEYYIFAMNGVFKEDGKAYHAPFPNVGQNGKICFGSNKPPEVESGNMEKAWKMFIETPFNADLAQGKSVRDKQDVRNSLVKFQGKSAYPITDLISTRDTIGDLIGRRIKEGELYVH